MTTADQWRNAAIVLREHAAKFDQMAEDQAQEDPWYVPPWARPHCSLNPVKSCTSWSCLVDRCTLAEGMKDD
jgi:hypothetical protein